VPHKYTDAGRHGIEHVGFVALLFALLAMNFVWFGLIVKSAAKTCKQLDIVGIVSITE
jgi:hypothetical protein